MVLSSVPGQTTPVPLTALYGTFEAGYRLYDFGSRDAAIVQENDTMILLPSILVTKIITQRLRLIKLYYVGVAMVPLLHFVIWRLYLSS